MIPDQTAVSQVFHIIDPLEDPRWADFVQKHPRASVFHTTSWLKALLQTYGYQPLVFTTSPHGSPLQNGVVFCKVATWIVRPRLVSLPFSDHADPLLDQPDDLDQLLLHLQAGQASGQWSSIEFRSPHQQNLPENWVDFHDGQTYLLHRLDLRPDLQQLFRNLQKDSIQRKIRRAEREGLKYEEGCSDDLLKKFYNLTLLTRRRQSLPPPPFAWFRNVLDSLGDMARLRIAYKDTQPIGAVFTLFHRETAVYKYGCTDARFHQLGVMPFLLWKTIEDAKQRGATQLDMGRSDLSNEGLITFKDRFGAARSTLTYKKYPGKRRAGIGESRRMVLAKRVFGYLPDKLLVLAGKLLYPHIG